jgi:hypothetical protein
LADHGVQLYIESLEKIRDNAHFKATMTEVNSCYSLFKGRGKTEKVCEHDALLMLLIRELRKGQAATLLGPNYWFVTGDESLSCVDKYINFIPDFRDKTPSSMLCDVWLEMISPFLPLSSRETEAYEAFAMLIKNQFALVPFQIDAKTLVKIQGSWTQYEGLQAGDIIKIQNKEWTRQYLKRLEKAKSEKDKAKTEDLGQLFAKKLEEELRTIMDNKLKKLAQEKQVLSKREALLSTTVEEKKAEIDNAKKIVEAQKEDITRKQELIQLKDKELEREAHFKRQLRTVSTIAGLFLVFSPLVMLVLKALPITLESVTYCAVSLIVGAVLLFFGIAPERANVSVDASMPVPKSKAS